MLNCQKVIIKINGLKRCELHQITLKWVEHPITLEWFYAYGKVCARDWMDLFPVPLPTRIQSCQTSFMKHLLFIGCGLLLGLSGCATAQEPTDNSPLAASDVSTRTNGVISPRAETVLHSACEFLAQTRAFSLKAEIWREHVDESGQKIQFSRAVTMDVKRPDGLRLEISSPLAARGFWYDGRTLTILDRKHNWYGTNAMPPTLDQAVAAAHDEGIDLPLIDLAMSDPYANATAKVEQGKYFGSATVLGVPCHHLAFTQENVDWQIWIEDGPQPLIRKFVITYKNEPGAPEFTALITHWNLTDRIADSNFIFERPPGASKIDMRTDEPAGDHSDSITPNEK